MRLKLPETLQEVYQESLERWKSSESKEESTLLRLDILRTLARKAHSEKSRSLAKGEKKTSEQVALIEPHLESMRFEDLSKLSLDEVLNSSPSGLKPRSIDAQLWKDIPQRKIERYDRVWEREMVAEALRLKWKIWSLKAWIKVSTAENFHEHLNQHLWPQGVLLYVEAIIDAHNPGPITLNQETLWHGSWIFVYDENGNPNPQEITHLPGASTVPSLPEVGLCFPK